MFKPILITILLVSLSACSAVEPDSEQTIPVIQQEPEIPPAPVPQFNKAEQERAEQFRRTMEIADILYAARLAYEDDRLMLPEEDNAYDRYISVLQIEPDNQVALDGLDEIATRYIQLATRAIERGQYPGAETLLDYAARVNPDNQNISVLRQELQQARQVQVDYFSLDPEALEQQSLEMLLTLSEIGMLIREAEATFLITARSDEEARWIYKIMREAVGGYRLRGNIVLGEDPAVQVNIPRT